jgi:hypothetical protein
MPSYHPDAETEARAILAHGGHGVKRCMGMMIQRHIRIDDGTEPLILSECIGSGSGNSTLYEVRFAYNALSAVNCVYQQVGPDVTLLAIDAKQGLARVGLPSTAPDARARAWNRST